MRSICAGEPARPAGADAECALLDAREPGTADCGHVFGAGRRVAGGRLIGLPAIGVRRP